MTKTKTDQLHIHHFRFLLLWAGTNAFGWVIIYVFTREMRLVESSFLQFGQLGTVLGLFTGGAQLLILNRYMNQSIKWWRILTTLGNAIGWTGVTLIPHRLFIMLPHRLEPGVLFSLVFVTPSVFQWFSLRRNFRFASLWIIATIASGILVWQILSGPTNPSLHTFMKYALAGALQGFVLGFTMLWLIERLSRDSNIRKEKIEYDEDGHVVHASGYVK